MKKLAVIGIFCCLLITCVNNAFAFSLFNKKDKPAILFNKNPITKENVMDYNNEFDTGRRIYYLITMPEEQYSRKLFIQIIKKDNVYELYGYKLIWSNLVQLKDEEIAYYTDYVVINEPGCYVMKVYSKDRPTKLYAYSQFWVK